MGPPVPRGKSVGNSDGKKSTVCASRASQIEPCLTWIKCSREVVLNVVVVLLSNPKSAWIASEINSIWWTKASSSSSVVSLKSMLPVNRSSSISSGGCSPSGGGTSTPARCSASRRSFSRSSFKIWSAVVSASSSSSTVSWLCDQTILQ